MTTTTTGLATISLVCLPTLEQDKAIAFYESLGFDKRTDQPFGGGYRWIEVYPPEGTTGIATIGSRRRCAAMASSSRVAAFSRTRRASSSRCQTCSSTTGGNPAVVTTIPSDMDVYAVNMLMFTPYTSASRRVKS